MIYCTSDFHFGHEKPFLYEPRGFSSYEEAAETTIKNYNSIITNEDIVYILGDCMLKNDEYGIKCLKQLNGRKLLAIGNHDSDARIERYKLEHIFEDIQIGYRIRSGKFSFWLTHYPMMMGNYKDKRPAWNLSGHTHKKDPLSYGKDCIYNVALDAHNNFPVSLDTIISDIKEYYQNYMKQNISIKRCDNCLYNPLTCGRSDIDGLCLYYKQNT